MHRAVVLTTLVLLLLAVAGVSVTQESRIFASGGPNSDDSPGSTSQERTSFEATVAEDTMTSAPPRASSELKAGENTSEPTVVTESTVGETEKPTAAARGEERLSPGSNNVGKPANSGRGVGKPEHAGKAPNIGKTPDDVGHSANGKPQERGNEEHERGGIQQKVTFCHKGKKTLTVGAPALAAHQRHGDTQGACHTEGAGPEPSGETMGPKAANNGGGGNSGGQDKVIFCHKNKNTLKVGAQAQAAHLRHGDSLGACRPAG